MSESAYRDVAQSVAGLSILGNAFICVSYHLFDELYRDNVYRLVYWESLSALLYSFAFIFGRPSNGSVGCLGQSVIFQYYGMTSMLSIYLILYHMHKLFKREELQVAALNTQRRYTFKITWKTYMFVWVFPLLLMVIPFITKSYGQTDKGDKKRSLCWIRLESWTDFYVMLSVFYIPLLIIFMFCIYHVVVIVWYTASKLRSFIVYSFHVCVSKYLLYLYVIHVGRIWSSDNHILCSEVNDIPHHFPCLQYTRCLSSSRP